MRIAMICWIAVGLMAGTGFGASALPPQMKMPMPKVFDDSAAVFEKGRLQRDELFRPLRTEAATLSPDGRYVAYSIRENETISVVVVEVDHPDVVTAKVAVATDYVQRMSDNREKTPGAVRWMKWVTPTRITVETNQLFTYGSASSIAKGSVVAFNADGSDGRTLVTPMEIAGYLPPNSDHFRRKRDSSGGVIFDAMTEVSSTNEYPYSVLGGGGRGGRGMKTIVRSPKVFDLCPDDPESILIQARGGQGLGLFKLNVVTGKLKNLSEDITDDQFLPLYDRQGLPRVGLRTSTADSFPHRFVYDSGSNFIRGTDLNKLTASAGHFDFTVSPDNFFGPRSIPLAFDDNPEFAYVASNVGRDTYGIYQIELKTGKRTGREIEHPLVDLITPQPNGYANEGNLVFDRYDRKLSGVRYADTQDTTLWLKPGWAALQAKLEHSLPGKSVEILEWDRSEHRFLLSVHGPTDAGGFAVFDLSTSNLTEFVRRAPWLQDDEKPAPKAFVFTSPTGGRISGRVILPKDVRLKPIPFVIFCPDDPWQQVSSDYRPEILTLTDLGVAVVQVNLRGAWGFGIKYRESIKEGYDRAQVDDLLATIDYLTKALPLNSKRVALFGHARGGYLAVRALQLHPERFRCAVGLDPTVDLDEWLEDAHWRYHQSSPVLTEALLGEKAQLKKAALADYSEPTKKPVMLLSYPGVNGSSRTPAFRSVSHLASRIKEQATPVELVELSDEFVGHLPHARAVVYGQIEEFLNEYLYAYDVKLGDTEEIEEKRVPPAKAMHD